MEVLCVPDRARVNVTTQWWRCCVLQHCDQDLSVVEMLCVATL